LIRRTRQLEYGLRVHGGDAAGTSADIRNASNMRSPVGLRLVRGPAASTTTAVALLTVCGCDMYVDADTRVARAEKQLAAADYTTAVIELRKALKDEPNSARAHFLLAEAALQLSDPDNADRELRRALDLGLAPPAAADLMARTELALGRYQPLLDQIERGQAPLQEPARSLYRGQSLHGLKREAEAVSAYQAALAVDPHSQQAALALAEAYTAQGQFASALAVLSEVLDRRPDLALGWLRRGMILGERGEFTEATEALQTALDHASGQLTLPQHAELLTGLIETRLARGDVEGAAATQKQLADLSSDSALTHFAAARVALARQDYPTATSELHRVLVGVPEFLPARLLLGTALVAQGNLEQADQELAQVVRDTPANLEARKLLARVRLRLQRPEEAMRVLIPGMEMQPADTQLRVLMNTAGSQLGTDPGGIAFLEDSVTTHPDNEDLKVSLAAAYLSNKEEAKAIEVLNRTSGKSRLALARWYLEEKQSRKAQEVIDQVLAAEPGRADLVNLAGLLYLDAGHYEQALAQLRAAADREPGNPGYWCNVAQAQLALHQPAAAHEAIAKALAIRADLLPAVAVAALVDLSTGRPDAAVVRVVELRQKHPDEAQIVLLEGDVRIAARQYGEAAQAFAKAERLHPSTIVALKSYNARRLAGITDPAQPLRRWLQREPEDLEVRLVLAEAEQTAEPAKAIAEYEWILKRAPKNSVALNNLAWLYQGTGDERALDTARKAHELAPSVPEIADTYGWILLQHGQIAEALPILKVAAAAGDPQITAHYTKAQKLTATAPVQRR
jgi:tetratricopeptide (TPR) repeat protein